jgi:3'-phosphoadenosine 5'-phosphosulfate sulfotransferase (PAPS reductase)/FAD synthetase
MVYESGISPDRFDVTFCNTHNEDPATLAHLELISKRVHPIKTLEPALGFFDLAAKKGLFPSRRKQFCTEHLKIIPTAAHIGELLKTHAKVVAVSGVRADESEERKDLSEWDYSGRLLTLQWRPLIRWTQADVIALHEKYGVPMNPLYAMGARRVGCFPCVNCVKKEIRMVALSRPEKIDEIERQEIRVGANNACGVASFFHRNVIPLRFRTVPMVAKTGERMMVASIRDCVRWAMTGKRAKGRYDDEPEEKESACRSGFCE